LVQTRDEKITFVIGLFLLVCWCFIELIVYNAVEGGFSSEPFSWIVATCWFNSFQCLTALLCFLQYRFSLRIKSLTIESSGVTATYVSGYSQSFAWDDLRYVDPLFPYIVFCDSNYFFMTGLYSREVLDLIATMSNGRSLSLERKTILGVRLF
jgi:hypothetical protein